MFQNLFSFKGRIRRLEYGLTTLMIAFAQFAMQVLVMTIAEDTALVFVLPYLGLSYISLAQGAKRCHDRGHSGWFQLIPFYVFWLLFADGKPGANEYGPNPKLVPSFQDDSILDTQEFV